MTILITGNKGFIGKYVQKEFENNNIDVIGVDLKDGKDLFDIPINNARLCLPDLDAIIHMAANLEILNVDPIKEMDLNIRGTVHMLEVARKMDTPKFVFACYDETTRILTEKGLKYYYELNINDKVFTLNKDTEQIELQPIDKIFVYDYNGKMLHFNSRSFDLLVTPNHKLVIRGASTNKKIILEEAEKTALRSVYRIPNGKWIGEKTETIMIDNTQYNMKDVLYLIGLFIGDGCCSLQKNKAKCKSGLNREKYIEKGRDKNTGRFISVNYNEQDYNLSENPRIFFAIPREHIARDCLIETLKRMNIKFCSEDKGVYIFSYGFMKLFDECGKYAVNKVIPEWCLKLDKCYLEYLYKGIMDSDGAVRKPLLTTISPKLTEQFIELVMKIGGSVHYKKYEPKIATLKDGRNIKGNFDVYHIGVSKKERILGNTYSKPTIEEYKGKVWCVQVPNHIIYVERNGDVCWSGNSSADCYGEPKLDTKTVYTPSASDVGLCKPYEVTKIIPSKETDELKPFWSYASSKVAGEVYTKQYEELYGIKTVVIRPSIVCGRKYEWYGRFLTLSLLRILKNEPILIFGDGQQTRDFVDVKDVANIICQATIKNIKTPETLNAGSGVATSINDLSKIIINCATKLGYEPKINYINPKVGDYGRKPHEQRNQLLSMKHTKSILGIDINTNLEEIVTEQLMWLKSLSRNDLIEWSKNPRY